MHQRAAVLAVLVASTFAAILVHCTAKELKTRAGIPVFSIIPPYLLPQDVSVDILTANYRLIGPVADVERALEIADVVQECFRRLYNRARYQARIADIRPSLVVPTEHEDSDERSEGPCMAHPAVNGSLFGAVDIALRVGMTRETIHIDMGSPEWAYSKIVQTMLYEQGFNFVVMHLFLDVWPTKQAIDILKRIPGTALYAEETVVKLTALSSQCSSLLPFDGAKQNLLLKSLDSLGFHISAGISRFNISRVRQSCSFEAGVGYKGTVKVNLITQRDKPDILFSKVFMALKHRLLEAMAEEGLKLSSAAVVSSVPVYHHSLEGQIISKLEAGDEVKAFKTSLPANQLPRFQAQPSAESLQSYGWIQWIVAAAVAVIAGRLLLSRRGAPHVPSGRNVPYHSVTGSTAAPGKSGSRASDDLIQAGNAILLNNPSAGVFGGATLDDSHSANVFATYLDQPYMHPSPFSNAPAGRTDVDGAWQAPCLLREEPSSLRMSTSSADSLQLPAQRSPAPEQGKRSRSFERVDSIQGWRIEEGEIQICQKEGRDWLLGSGAYGRVYKGLRDGLQDVACKVLHQGDELREKQFVMEIKLQKSLSFDTNIVHFLGVTRHSGRPMLVLEYMEGGDLCTALHTPGSTLGWRNRGKQIALDIVRGLAFLHKHSVLHGDLKSHNVLLARHSAYAKLSDVGLSRFINSDLTSQSMSPAGGTFAFAAPELLLGLNCTAKADIFSLGVLLWEMCTMEIPKRGLMRDIRVPEECPQEISDLIDRCLTYDPTQRPSCQEVFECIQQSIRAEMAEPNRLY